MRYKMLSARLIKDIETGNTYEVQHVFHSNGFEDRDVFACYRLSHTDGMPIGPQVHIAKAEIEGAE